MDPPRVERMAHVVPPRHRNHHARPPACRCLVYVPLPPDDIAPETIDFGTAGASARREYQRRRANREKRTREKHPLIGGALLALRDDPSHERVWASGADGEERVARELAKRLDDGILVLQDRRIPGSRANIDHIAVAPSGVWVIDSKRYKGKVAIHTPLLGKARLTVAGRDKTKLIDGLARQVELVTAAMAEIAPEVPIHGALCFVDADLPLVFKLTFKGFPILYPRQLAKRINGTGPVTAEGVRAAAEALARRFPSA